MTFLLRRFVFLLAVVKALSGRCVRKPGLVLVGFYEQRSDCASPLTSSTRYASLLLVNLKEHPGINLHERRLKALGQLARSNRHNKLFTDQTVIIFIDIKQVTLRTRVNTVPGITRTLYKQLEHGDLLIPAHSNSTKNVVGLFKYIRTPTPKYIHDVQHSVFCDGDGLYACGDALVQVDNGRRIIKRTFKQACLNHVFRANIVDHHVQTDPVRKDDLYWHLNYSIVHFWINLDESADRRRHMLSSTASLTMASTRVSAWSFKEVRSLIESQQVVVPPILAEKQRSRTFLREVACILSHLTALHRAYVSGVRFALVTEDDVSFGVDFEHRIARAIDQAPRNWEILQLLTVNKNLVKKLSSLHTSEFVRWYPTHWSSAAYIVSRIGMQHILENWSVKESTLARRQGTIIWKFPEDGVYLADEALFYKTRTYTFQTSIVQQSVLALASSIQKGKIGVLIHTAPRLISAGNFTPSSLLMISSIRIRQTSDFYRNMELLFANFKEFQRTVGATELKVNAVCTNEKVATEIKVIVAKFQEPRIVVTVSLNPLRFNKFLFVSQVLQDFQKFEKVLLLDSDMDLVGFPIPEFFEVAARYIIAGTVHQNTNDMLHQNQGKTTRQWFKIFDGFWWQRNAPGVVLVETTFVEQAFALIDARFAKWFFEQILTNELLLYTGKDEKQHPRESDFGPDLLWCGAAAQWLHQMHSVRWSEPCGLFTFPIHHTDDRQLGIQAVDRPQNATQLAMIEQKPLKLLRKRFPKWYKYSLHFVHQTGGKTKLSWWFKRQLLKRSYSCFSCAHQGCHRSVEC